MKTMIRYPLIVAAAILLGSVPWFGSDVLTQFGISVLLLAVLTQSWNIIGGFTGYTSFGNSVFYGLGSYGVAIAMVQWKLSFGVGLLFGVALAVAFASAGQKADEFRGAAQDKVQEFRGAAEKATSQAKSWQAEGEAYVRDNPTKAVLVALGVGLLLGFLLRK